MTIDHPYPFEPASETELNNMEPSTEFTAFRRLVEILRMECPWDRAQTHDSIKENLLEEAYEVVDAIDRNAMTDLKHELGDLLLHVLFQSLLATETGTFTIEDVIEGAMKKLIRRHPHVFTSMKLENETDVASNWEEIKMKEGRRSVLEGVPDHLPSLIRAYRIQEKAANIGFDWDDREGALDSVREEFDEFSETLEQKSSDRQTEELGDLLFSLVNVARKSSLSAEEALRMANRKFESRFKYIEARLQEKKRGVGDASLDEMDQLWNEAKEQGL